MKDQWSVRHGFWGVFYLQNQQLQAKLEEQRDHYEELGSKAARRVRSLATYTCLLLFPSKSLSWENKKVERFGLVWLGLHKLISVFWMQFFVCGFFLFVFFFPQIFPKLINDPVPQGSVLTLRYLIFNVCGDFSQVNCWSSKDNSQQWVMMGVYLSTRSNGWVMPVINRE